VSFVVETGAGVPNANAYATVAFGNAYLADRNRAAENGWQSSSATRKQQAIVAATDYIDMRHGPRIKGARLRRITPGREATGTVTFTSLPLLNETVTVGQITYRFVDALTQENDVLRGVSTTTAAQNLAAALSGGDGVTSSALTQQNYEASATSALGVVTFTAAAEGTSGNEIVLTTTVTGATASAATLTGGLDEAPQRLIFPRRNLIGYDGVIVTGIPWKLKAATIEYAVRSLAAVLVADKTVDATGARVQRKREKVGPIEEETEYVTGASVAIYADYPAADRLLHEYLTGRGGVIR